MGDFNSADYMRLSEKKITESLNVADTDTADTTTIEQNERRHRDDDEGLLKQNFIKCGRCRYAEANRDGNFQLYDSNKFHIQF